MGGTYGGNAVACAAARATLRVFEEEQLLPNVLARGEQVSAMQLLVWLLRRAPVLLPHPEMFVLQAALRMA